MCIHKVHPSRLIYAAACEDEAVLPNSLPQPQHRLHNVALVVRDHLHPHQVHAPAVQQLQGRGWAGIGSSMCNGIEAAQVAC